MDRKIIQKHLRFEIDNKSSAFLDLSAIFLFSPKASENLSMWVTYMHIEGVQDQKCQKEKARTWKGSIFDPNW